MLLFRVITDAADDIVNLGDIAAPAEELGRLDTRSGKRNPDALLRDAERAVAAFALPTSRTIS